MNVRRHGRKQRGGQQYIVSIYKSDKCIEKMYFDQMEPSVWREKIRIKYPQYFVTNIQAENADSIKYVQTNPGQSKSLDVKSLLNDTRLTDFLESKQDTLVSRGNFSGNHYWRCSLLQPSTLTVSNLREELKIRMKGTFNLDVLNQFLACPMENQKPRFIYTLSNQPTITLYFYVSDKDQTTLNDELIPFISKQSDNHVKLSLDSYSRRVLLLGQQYSIRDLLTQLCPEKSGKWNKWELQLQRDNINTTSIERLHSMNVINNLQYASAYLKDILRKEALARAAHNMEGINYVALQIEEPDTHHKLNDIIDTIVDLVKKVLDLPKKSFNA